MFLVSVSCFILTTCVVKLSTINTLILKSTYKKPLHDIYKLIGEERI